MTEIITGTDFDGDTQVIFKEDLGELFPYEDSDDPNKKAHVVRAGDNPHIGAPDWTGQEVVDAARALGLEVTALCGYKWIPKHNPANHDACGTCLDIWGRG